MKTAIQELIEWVETRDEGEAEYRTAYNLAIAIANQHLEKEKEQIIDAHTNAYLIGEDDISVEDANKASEQYYNQTYNQNK